MDEQRRFSLAQLAQVSGLPYRSVANWRDDDTLRPRGEVKIGPRAWPYYGEQDVFAVVVAASLLRAGVTGEAIRTAVRFINRADLDKRLSAGLNYLVVSNSKQVFNVSAAAVFQTVDGQAGAVSFVTCDLARARSLFRARLALLDKGGPEALAADDSADAPAPTPKQRANARGRLRKAAQKESKKPARKVPAKT